MHANPLVSLSRNMHFHNVCVSFTYSPSDSSLYPLLVIPFSHGGHSGVFSCRGIRICVEFFKKRGHQLITSFLPHWRKCRPPPGTTVTFRHELDSLEKEGILVYTPSRKIGNKLVASYDDRYVNEINFSKSCCTQDYLMFNDQQANVCVYFQIH